MFTYPLFQVIQLSPIPSFDKSYIYNLSLSIQNISNIQCFQQNGENSIQFRLDLQPFDK